MCENEITSVIPEGLKCYWAKCFISETNVVESVVFATSEKFAKKMLTRRIKRDRNLDVKEFELYPIEIKPQAVIPLFEFVG